VDEQLRLYITGMLHYKYASCEDAARNYDEPLISGSLEIFPEYQDGRDGLVTGQAMVVLFRLHKSDSGTFEIC